MREITRNPINITDTLNGRKAKYYGGNPVARWYWGRLPGDIEGYDGFLTSDGKIYGVRHVANGYYAEDLIV